MKWHIISKVKVPSGVEGYKKVIQTILLNRGIRTGKQIAEFLSPKLPHELLPKEVGLETKEISKGIKRIKKAIKRGEKIVVYGDYDADGICSTAIMWETLTKVGANAMPYIPRREEGCGLKVKRLDQLAKEGVSLVITVDHGITATRQVAHAKKIGIDIIITDHHTAGKSLPDSFAIIHTTKLAGSGVAWLFSREIRRYFKKTDNHGLDLAVIGTITDIVPLLEANRSIVKHGMVKVRDTKRIGLVDLFSVAGLDPSKIGTYEIGFVIGPRINASGRIEDPMDPLRLICLRSDSARANLLAEKLNVNNKSRQVMTEETYLDARQKWLREKNGEKIIFVESQAYSQGIIGLVASKLTEEFYLPSIVLSKGETESRASARSIVELNIIEAIRNFSDLLKDHGGHRYAAGFTIRNENISDFRSKINDYVLEKLKNAQLSPLINIDLQLNFDDIGPRLIDELGKLEPYGEGNPAPVFMTEFVYVQEAFLVGRDKNHLKLKLTGSPDGRTSLGAIAFGKGDFYHKLSPDKPLKIVYNLGYNEWNGSKKIELRIKDIKID